jgi:hypothetical protein
VGTQVKQTTSTNESGFFRVSSLPPGIYEVSVEAQGFQPARSRIVVQTEQTAVVPIRMHVAGTVEQVQVSAKGFLLAFVWHRREHACTSCCCRWQCRCSDVVIERQPRRSDTKDESGRRRCNVSG